MDMLEHYRQIVKQTLSRQAAFSPSHGQIETIPVFDEKTDNYMVVDVGWDQPGRVHAVILHRVAEWQGVGRSRRHRGRHYPRIVGRWHSQTSYCPCLLSASAA